MYVTGGTEMNVCARISDAMQIWECMYWYYRRSYGPETANRLAMIVVARKEQYAEENSIH